MTYQPQQPSAPDYQQPPAYQPPPQYQQPPGYQHAYARPGFGEPLSYGFAEGQPRYDLYETKNYEPHSIHYRADEHRSRHFRTSPDCSGCMGTVISLVLAAGAALACYYCITHGFDIYDSATRGIQYFIGGSLLYMGFVFSIVAVGNLIMAYCRAAGNCSRGERDEIGIANQAIVSAFAPLVAIPFALWFGVKSGLLGAMLEKGRRH